MAQTVKRLPPMRETQVQLLGREDLREKGMATHSRILASPPTPPKKRLTETFRDFPGGSEVKASASNAGDPGLIPGSGRYPGEGNGTPLQYSCLGNPMDGGAW